MKKLHTVLALTMALGLAACNEQPSSVMTPDASTASAADTSPVLATVNGVPITQNTLNFHKQQRNARRPGEPIEDEQLLQEIINLELMHQEAQKSGIDTRPEIAIQLAHQRRGFLASVAVQQYSADNPVTEDAIRALYDEHFGSADQEFKARHILVETEDQAREIITALDGGGDFAALAKERSTDPMGANGGDLGWFAPGQMVKPFAEAAAQLETGQYTKDPVQTQYGWHVILLEDRRETTPPAYEEMHEQLRMMAQNQQLQQYLEKMQQDASIEMK
ncbi:MAG TPA: peptidylprolyl isomerase [Gammaproteobacteria bacterium]|nr:peptidylprolyl isomerase [Gammaproteobacteria bacterium]